MTGRRIRRPAPTAGALEVAFSRIRADRRHGAHALGEAALEALTQLLDRWSRAGERPSRASAERVARLIEKAQPAMGSFVRWAREWRRLRRASSPDRFVSNARAWVRRERAQLRSEEGRLARIARARYPRSARCVVTLSRSRSVLGALSTLPTTRRPTEVLVLESLPGGEGRGFARDLRRAGLRARVVPDSEGEKAVGTADLVVIGADAVYADGSVAHKVGTRSLARAAFRRGVPVVVVAGRSKFTGRPALRRALPALFDRTPSRYITEVWTDRGVRAGRPPARRPPERSSH